MTLTFESAGAALAHAFMRDHRWDFACLDCRALTLLDVRIRQAGEGGDGWLPFQIVPSWEMALLMNPDAQKQWLALEVQRLAALRDAP